MAVLAISSARMSFRVCSSTLKDWFSLASSQGQVTRIDEEFSISSREDVQGSSKLTLQLSMCFWLIPLENTNWGFIEATRLEERSAIAITWGLLKSFFLRRRNSSLYYDWLTIIFSTAWPVAVTRWCLLSMARILLSIFFVAALLIFASARNS